MSRALDEPFAAHRPARRFYLRMACACAAIAFAGFAPSYLVPLVGGVRAWPPVLHVHGALLFSWVTFFCWQTWLVADGRVARHRAWGVFGVALAAASVLASVAAVASRTAMRETAGFVVEARSFAWVGISDMLIFGGLVTAAMLNIRRPESHKRLMLMSTVSLLGPPIGRWVLLALQTFVELPAPAADAPPPVSAAYVPHVLSFSLVAIAALRDRRTIGRVHPVYVVTFGVMVAQLVSLQAVAQSETWQRLAGACAAVMTHASN